MKRYKILGTTDEHLVCDLCGREDLKSTVALLDTLTDETVHFGSDCAARASGWTVKEIVAEAKMADAAAAAEAAHARYLADAEEHARWTAFVTAQTGILDLGEGIAALGGFGPARAAYRDAA